MPEEINKKEQAKHPSGLWIALAVGGERMGLVRHARKCVGVGDGLPTQQL